MFTFKEIFCTPTVYAGCGRGIGPPLKTTQYVPQVCTSGFMDDVIFSHNVSVYTDRTVYHHLAGNNTVLS